MPVASILRQKQHGEPGAPQQEPGGSRSVTSKNGRKRTAVEFYAPAAKDVMLAGSFSDGDAKIRPRAAAGAVTAAAAGPAGRGSCGSQGKRISSAP